MRVGRRRNYLGETNAQVTERRLNACEENLKDIRLTLNRMQSELNLTQSRIKVITGKSVFVEPEEG
jgi:hypothetical protein